LKPEPRKPIKEHERFRLLYRQRAEMTHINPAHRFGAAAVAATVISANAKAYMMGGGDGPLPSYIPWWSTVAVPGVEESHLVEAPDNETPGDAIMDPEAIPGNTEYDRLAQFDVELWKGYVASAVGFNHTDVRSVHFITGYQLGSIGPTAIIYPITTPNPEHVQTDIDDVTVSFALKFVEDAHTNIFVEKYSEETWGESPFGMMSKDLEGLVSGDWYVFQIFLKHSAPDTWVYRQRYRKFDPATKAYTGDWTYLVPGDCAEGGYTAEDWLPIGHYDWDLTEFVVDPFSSAYPLRIRLHTNNNDGAGFAGHAHGYIYEDPTYSASIHVISVEKGTPDELDS